MTLYSLKWIIYPTHLPFPPLDEIVLKFAGKRTKYFLRGNLSLFVFLQRISSVQLCSFNLVNYSSHCAGSTNPGVTVLLFIYQSFRLCNTQRRHKRHRAQQPEKRKTTTTIKKNMLISENVYAKNTRFLHKQLSTRQHNLPLNEQRKMKIERCLTKSRKAIIFQGRFYRLL